MFGSGEWRDGPWFFVVGGVAVVVGVLIAVAGDGGVADWIRGLAGVGIVIAVAVPLVVVWRLYLRSGRGRHGRS
jgi:hypothetical protein